MPRHGFSSLRVRLILLVLLALIPSLGVMIYSSLHQRQRAIQEAQEKVFHLVQDVSNMQDNLIDEVRSLLFTMAQVPKVQQRDQAACNSIFASLLEQKKQYAGFAAFQPDGESFAIMPASSAKINVADRTWYQRLIKTQDFVASEYLLGRLTGKPVIVFAQPVFAPDHRLQAILTAALDLSWLQHHLARKKLSPGLIATVLDRNGTILARYPGSAELVGRIMPESPLIKAILTNQEGVMESPGLEGVDLILGYTYLGPQYLGTYIMVSIPKAEVFGNIRQEFLINLSWLGLVTVLALAAAWFGGDFFIRRPVNDLLGLTERLAAGDLMARTGPLSFKGEFGELGQAFNQMAISLQHRETELRQAEELASRESAKFELLLKIASDGIHVLDEGGNLVIYSESFLGLLGYSHEEAETLHVSKWDVHFASEELIGKFLELINNPAIFETKHRRRDGSIIDVEINACGIELEGKQYLYASARDITERKRLGELLRQSEEKFRGIFETANEGIWVVNANFATILINQKLTDILGYTPEEMNGLSPEAFIFADDLKAYQVYADRYLQGIEESIDLRAKHKDGSIRWLHLNAKRILDQNGSFSGGFAMLTDITERKQAEEAFRILVQNAPIGIFIVQDGRFQLLNPGCAITSSYTTEELTGIQSLQLIHPDYREMVRANAVQMVKGNLVLPCEFPIITKSGEIRWIMEKLTSTLYQGRRATLGYFLDITERKQAEEEREKLISELQKALAQVKTLSGLLPICAHCKKIRDDEGYWQSVEKYIYDRAEVEFSHGICPGCLKKYYPDYYQEK